jgi:hypothetical protein
METTRVCILITLVGLGLLIVVPAGAVLQKTTYMGTVTSIDPSKQTITISADAMYLCRILDGNPACTWSPIQSVLITGRVPDPLALSITHVGTTVEATITGGPGGFWIGIGNIHPRDGTFYAEQIIGEPYSLPAPLAGNYSISPSLNPDCSRCSGTVCPALSALVTLLHDDTPVLEKTLAPGEHMLYSREGDSQQVNVSFIHGEASSMTCHPKEEIVGPQPESVFFVQVLNVSPNASISSTSSSTTTVTEKPVLTQLVATDTSRIPTETSHPLQTVPVGVGMQPSVVLMSLFFIGLLNTLRKR